MSLPELFINVLLIGSVAYIFYLILREPILLLKSLIRGLKDVSSPMQILLVFIWGPIWIIDKIFGLKIFINETEEASVKFEIQKDDYTKYCIIEGVNLEDLKAQIDDFITDCKSDTSLGKFDYSLFKLVQNIDGVILFFPNSVNLKAIFELHTILANYQIEDKLLYIRSVFLNNKKTRKSFYLLSRFDSKSWLVGKNGLGKKLYVDVYSNDINDGCLHYNSNLDYISSFNLWKFKRRVKNAHFISMKK